MAEIVDITPEESIQQNLNHWCLEVGSEFEKHSIKAANKFIKYINKETVVDLGCGDGAATNVFLKNGNKVIAVDINKEKLKHINKKADIICQDAISYMKYTVLQNVFMHHALEHIVNYQEVLDSISKKLVKNGYCYIAVPKGDKPHSVHHVAFSSIEEITPPGLTIIDSNAVDDNEWPEYWVIAKKV